MSKITSNPPETVPWSEYRIMVDQRDSFRVALREAERDAAGARAALAYLQELIAANDLPADALSRPFDELRDYRDSLREEGFDPGPWPADCDTEYAEGVE